MSNESEQAFTSASMTAGQNITFIHEGKEVMCFSNATGEVKYSGRPDEIAECIAEYLTGWKRDAERFRALEKAHSYSRDERGYEINCMLHYGMRTLAQLADALVITQVTFSDQQKPNDGEKV